MDQQELLKAAHGLATQLRRMKEMVESLSTPPPGYKHYTEAADMALKRFDRIKKNRT